jgi:hypothetical protein
MSSGWKERRFMRSSRACLRRRRRKMRRRAMMMRRAREPRTAPTIIPALLEGFEGLLLGVRGLEVIGRTEVAIWGQVGKV